MAFPIPIPIPLLLFLFRPIPLPRTYSHCHLHFFSSFLHPFQLAHILRGIYEVVPQYLISAFTFQELELLLIGR